MRVYPKKRQSDLRPTRFYNGETSQAERGFRRSQVDRRRVQKGVRALLKSFYRMK